MLDRSQYICATSSSELYELVLEYCDATAYSRVRERVHIRRGNMTVRIHSIRDSHPTFVEDSQCWGVGVCRSPAVSA